MYQIAQVLNYWDKNKHPRNDDHKSVVDGQLHSDSKKNRFGCDQDSHVVLELLPSLSLLFCACFSRLVGITSHHPLRQRYLKNNVVTTVPDETLTCVGTSR